MAGNVRLPAQFSEKVRKDMIKRAVEVCQANRRQPYGTDPRAGKRASAKISRRRRNFRGAYGKGISRVPRKIMSRNGANLAWIGAFAPSTVKGYRAHPPKASKQWEQKINSRERKKAIRSALAATLQREIVQGRNHQLPTTYPFAFAGEIEALHKTSDVQTLLEKTGLQTELDRTSVQTIRPGKGKNRGRPYRKKIGPLLVVSAPCKLSNAARNIPGIDVIPVRLLNAEVLAPGAVAGRLTIFTNKALMLLEEQKLFA